MIPSWQKFIDGDIESFQKIYTTYVDDLFDYGMNICGDKELVLDCIHDLFVRLFDNKRIAKKVNIKFYLFASLRRDILRSKSKAGRFIYEETLEEWELANSYELNLFSEGGVELDIQRLREKVEKLPKRQKEVLYLKYYVGLSYEEIAEAMKVDIASCRTLSFRAIRQLKLEFSTLKSFLILV